MPEYYKSESELTDEELISLWTTRKDHAETYQQTKIEIWNECYNLYAKIKNTESKKLWQSDLNVATAFTIVETLMPKLMLSFFGDKFVVDIKAKKQELVDEATKVLQLIKDQFEDMDAFLKFYEALKSDTIYGHGILKVFWKLETRKVVQTKNIFKKIIDVVVATGKRAEEKEEIIYDGPDIESINIYDFFVDPEATTIKNAKYCIHRTYKDKDYLLAQQYAGIYSNVDDLKPSVDSKIEANADQASNAVKISGFGTVDRDRLIEIWECWTDDRLVVIAEKNIIIRNQANPFNHQQKPFVLLKDTAMPNEFYGIGTIEPVIDLIKERNTLRNMRLDNVKAIVNKRTLVNKNADIDMDKLEEQNVPGGLIPTDDMNALKPIEETDIHSSIYSEDNGVARDIQEATAMSETTIGMTPRRGESATAIAKLAEASGSRFALKTEMLANGIIDLVKMIISLNRQFLKTEMQVITKYENGKPVYEKVIGTSLSGDYRYRINVGMAQMKNDIKRQQWLSLIGIWIMQQPNIDLVEIQKETLRLFEVENWEQFIHSLNEQEKQVFYNSRLMNGGMTPEVLAGGTPAKQGGVASVAGVSTNAVS